MWMRNVESFVLHWLIRPQQIEVECPGSPAHDADPPECGLDLEQAIEQRQRRQRRRDANRGVQETRLRRADRITLVDARERANLQLRQLGKQAQTACKVLARRAQVR